MSINLEPEFAIDCSVDFTDDLPENLRGLSEVVKLEDLEILRLIEEERLLIEAADAALLEAQYGQIVPAVLSEDFMQKFKKFTEDTPEVTKEFQKAIEPFVTVAKMNVEFSDKDSRGFWNAL